MKKTVLLSCACALSVGTSSAAHEHAIYESVSLDGAWEMAYRPYACESVEYPSFVGVRVEHAIPGYWEDMVSAFRAAGLKDEFRLNPWHLTQSFPLTGWAEDTTLPQVYGCFYYRRTVELERAGAAALRFEGVRNQVHAWVNGRFIAFRQGFSTPFELTVPEGVLRRGANEIVLAVSNNPNLGYCDYVCGLTTRSIYRSTGGVNGRLELRFPTSDLADVCVTTATDLKSFTIRIAGKDAFVYEIADGTNILARGRAVGDVTLPTDGYAFWSPETPKRYDLRISAGGGTFRQKFGLRRLTADGERFRLNGKPVYLRGVTEHAYFPESIHVPRDPAYYRMVTAKRKELGFNFVRFHTYVPPAEYLEAADELGMLVHVESPNFVPVHEYAAIVAFARIHPSVVIYCTGNETRIDRIAEAYLACVADIVHTETDALFTPMSALRGVEYMLMPGKDDIAAAPFPHNPARMARLANYSDFFTSYQQGAASYESLNLGTAADLDAWGDAYCGKPRTSHEICIDSTYADLSSERMYPADSPIVRAGIFSGLRRLLDERGLLVRADRYFRNSCEWMRRIRKFTFEKVRASRRTAGFDFLGDVNSHWHTFGYSVGMMDEFYRLKPGETVENVRRYNAAEVLLCDLGSDFVFRCGEAKAVAFSLSNYADSRPPGILRVTLMEKDGASVFETSLRAPRVPCGEVLPLGVVTVPFPMSATPKEFLLTATLGEGSSRVENAWEVYAFPTPGATGRALGVRVVSDISAEALVTAMENGERVLLLGAGPFKSLPTTFRVGLAGRCSGSYATVIEAGHPIFHDFPHEGYCGWQFRRLLEGGCAVQLEAGVPFAPVVDVASSVKCPIRQAALFEYRVGAGQLLVCSFALRAEDPAASWLKARLLAYAGSETFAPAQSLTVAQLRAVIAAPLVTGAANANVARNPSDPSSDVRAGDAALP